MKALEARFFNTVGNSKSTLALAPHEIHCGFHGWSIATFLLPTMKEGDFAWTNGDMFWVGTREQYLYWLSQTETPNVIWSDSYFPFGMYCAKVNGKFTHCRGISKGSAYCADKSNFYALLWALEGGPALKGKDIDYETERNRLGTGVYHTFCREFGVELPSYWVHNEESKEEEQNFLQKYL